MKEILYELASTLSRGVIHKPDCERFYKLIISGILYKEFIISFTQELEYLSKLLNPNSIGIETLSENTYYRLTTIYIAGIGNVIIEKSEKEIFQLELLNQ